MWLGGADRAAAVAWAPSAGDADPNRARVAAGTVSGTLGKDFDTSAKLELLDLPLGESNSDFNGINGAFSEEAAASKSQSSSGGVAVSERFHALAWAANPAWAPVAPQGIIAGALDSGAVNLWSASAVGKSDEGGALLATLQRHAGPAFSLDFNRFQGGLLASGAADGEVFIWSLDNPAEPAVYTLGTKVVQNDGLSKVSWNAQVPHILGTMHRGGSGVVWDLRNKRAVLQFANPDRKLRSRSLAWHPAEATQLLTASEDDTNPVIQMWDLRNAYAPVKELRRHTAGVWALSWSEHDTDLVLSSGKDGKILCWNVGAAAGDGELECEVESGSSGCWFFDVQWSPRTPGVLLGASFDNRVQLFSMNQSSSRSKAAQAESPAQGVDETSRQQPKRAPKWLKRPCGVAFTFGGKLISFSNSQVSAASSLGQPGVPDGASQIPKPTASIRTLKFNPAFLERAKKLQDMFEADDWAAVCRRHAETSSGGRRLQWEVLTSLLENAEPSAEGRRTLLMKALGYDPEVIALTLKKYVSGSSQIGSPETNGTLDDAASAQSSNNSIDGVDGVGVGDETESSSEEQQEPTVGGSSQPSSFKPPAAWIVPASGAPDLNLAVDTTKPLESTDCAVRSALLIGDYASAVAALKQAGRWAEALVLAAHGTRDLWSATQRSYLQTQSEEAGGEHGQLTRFIAAVVEDDLRSLIQAVAATDWQAALCAVLNYASPAEAPLLATLLGRRLLAESANVENDENDSGGLADAAVVCFIVAGDVDSAVAAWSAPLRTKAVGHESWAEAVTGVLEQAEALRRVVVGYGGSTGADSSSSLLAELFSTFAVAIAAQGGAKTALGAVSEAARTIGSDTLRITAYRCFESLPSDVAKEVENPPVSPFGDYAASVPSAQRAAGPAASSRRAASVPGSQTALGRGGTSPGAGVPPSAGTTANASHRATGPLMKMPMTPTMRPEQYGFGQTQNKSFGVQPAAPPPGGFQPRDAPSPSKSGKDNKATSTVPLTRPLQPAGSSSATQLPTPARLSSVGGGSNSSSSSGNSGVPGAVKQPLSSVMPPPPAGSRFEPRPVTAATAALVSSSPVVAAAPPPMGAVYTAAPVVAHAAPAPAPVAVSPPSVPSAATPAAAPHVGLNSAPFRSAPPSVAAAPPISVPQTSSAASPSAPPSAAAAPATASSTAAAPPAKPAVTMSDEAKFVVSYLEDVVSRANADGDKRASDLTKRFATLFQKLQNMQLSGEGITTLHEFCQACSVGNVAAAHKLHIKLTQTQWSALGSPVMIGLKKIIELSKRV